ncbi:uncharacterized protein RCC_06757 [Ramularia collo-cygni]|uniref:Uncharacterized protein n=1 Tax=Ramularia collo-cygni TaxID=112498 RepID=A0A2D3V808_9PEZI|nr:uncharacterized protein RCC_06757 [Ramularia collo-cygni]CZT20897.1 uncharacterized protein RCC_06757 [Ramularia collo-cygni]
MATSSSKKPHVPDELLKQIFSSLQPPLPEVLGRARYEHIQFANEDAEAVNQYMATHEQLLPRLKTNDEQHRIGLSTLSSIMRVCKRFETIGRPLLYESYPGQPLAGLQAFNRTLIGRPDLARMVKYITIGCWEIDMLQGLAKWWKTTIKKVSFGQKLLPALLKKAEAGHEDAQVALLLFLSTNVHTIDLSAPVLFHMSLVKSLVKETAQERPNTLFRGETEDLSPTIPDTLPLRKLQSLGIREGDTSLTVSVSAFNVLLQLQTITCLTLYRLGCSHDILPPMPQLQELCLWRCTPDADFCESLKICKGLKSLKIIWPGMGIDYMKNVYTSDTTIDYKYIGDMISENFPLLEKLVLDPREADLYGASCTQLHSLRLTSMRYLKELSVEAQALWDKHTADDRAPWEIEVPLPRLEHSLPPSITKLAVLVHRRGVHEPAMAAERTKLPRNQMLILNCCLMYLVDAPSSLRSMHLDMPYHEVQNGFTGLEDLFKEVGFVHGVINADPEVQRVSPVVGSMTPKEQRVKLRESFDMWLPETDSWCTVIIRKSGDVKSETELKSWRAVLDDKVEGARDWDCQGR